MDNGFYKCKELRIVIYEKEGSTDKSFVIVTNEDSPTDVVVMTGVIAENMIISISDCIDEATKEGS